MIIKEVLKLESGGVPAFTSYISVPQSLPTASSGIISSTDTSSTKKESSDELGLLTKDMLKAIYESGLPSDTLAFLKHLDLFMPKENGLFGGNNPFDKSSTVGKYKLLLMELTKLRSNKELLDNAVKASQTNGSFSEMAIALDGRYFVLDEDGNPHLTSTIKHGDRVLSNAELADLRTNKIADNNYISTVILNGVSMSTIDKRIWDAISKMGSTEESRQFFRTKKGLQIKDGIDKLLSDGEDGTYKITQKSSDLTVQTKAALDYIISTLRPNEVALLRGKASLMGLKPGEGSLKLVESLLKSGMSASAEIGVSYDANSNKEKGTDKKELEALLKLKAEQSYKLQSGEGGSPSQITINPGQHFAMLVKGAQFGQLLNRQGDSVKNGSLENVLQESRMSMYTDTGNGVYVGNQRIDPENFNQVYINTSLVARAWLPAVYEADGSVHPDYTLLDEYARIEKLVKGLGSHPTKAAVESIIRKSPLSIYVRNIDDDGNIQWDLDKFRPFLMLNAMATGKNTWGGLGDDISVGVLNPKTLDNWATDIKYMQGIKEEDLRNKMSAALGYGVKGDIYSAIAYIPVSDSSNRSLGNDSTLETITLEERNRHNSQYIESKTNSVIQ